MTILVDLHPKILRDHKRFTNDVNLQGNIKKTGSKSKVAEQGYQSYKLAYIPGMQTFVKSALYKMQKMNLNKPEKVDEIQLDEALS